jgi:hypothetical protein
MQAPNRLSVCLLCSLAISMTAIAGCASGSSKDKTLAPSTTSPTTSSPRETTTTSSAPHYGDGFKNGNTTMTVGAKTYVLDVFATVNGGDHTHLVWKNQNGGPETSFNSVHNPDGTSFGSMDFLDGQRMKGDCSVTASKSDATAYEGTFDCPKLSTVYSDGTTTVEASGSFSATP